MPSSHPDGCWSTSRGCCRRAKWCWSIARSKVCLEITCGPAAYKLNTYSAEDFPKLPEVEGAQTFTVDNAAFLETVTKVARAASRDESRPVLTGVLVHFEGSKPRHGRDRLVPDVGQETEALEEAAGAELEAIVPARALTALADRAGRRGAPDRRPGEPRRLRRRRRLADDASDRRAVPEPQAADSRDLRARDRAAPRGVPRGRAARGRDGAAELAASAAVRGG